MTVPVSMLNKQLDEENMEQEMSFYVDAKHQEDPPSPNNPNLYITTRPEMSVYTRYSKGSNKRVGSNCRVDRQKTSI